MKRNGYFQLVHQSDGTYLKVYGPTDGGEPVKTKEVLDYLNAREILYEPKAVGEAVTGAENAEECLKQINKDEIRKERESCSIFLSEDRMKAYARFTAPSEGIGEGGYYTVDELMSDLKVYNIRAGIRKDVIAAFMKGRVYGTTFVVAMGKPPRQGTDASIKYHFDAHRKAKPELNEDGSVDFKKLNALNYVKEGDLLAELIPEDPGEPGMNIFGDVVKPRDVKRTRLEYGRNIRISEDHKQIFSMVTGHVMLYGTQVFVSNEYEVEDVGVATGDIEYDGNVAVHGNVQTGFTIKATGDISVHGVVEGAVLEAGGNIIIERGMNGMSKGVLKAKGHIVSKFMENATVTAGDFISTESIMNCHVSSGSEIEVTGRRGFIAGGDVSATSKIEAKTLGSTLGATTNISVGVDPQMKREMASLQKQVQENNVNISKIEPILNNMFQKQASGQKLEGSVLMQLQTLSQTRRQKVDENRKLMKRIEELSSVMEIGANPCVICTGEVYPGVKISIGDVSKFINDSVSYCRFIREGGDVRLTGI